MERPQAHVAARPALLNRPLDVEASDIRAWTNGDTIVQDLPGFFLGAVWHAVEPMLQKAVAIDPERFTVEGIAQRIVNGAWTAFLLQDMGGAPRAIVCANLVEMDTGALSAQILWVAGSRVGRAETGLILDCVADWGKRNNAFEVLYTGREGWLRLEPRMQQIAVCARMRIER